MADLLLNSMDCIVNCDVDVVYGYDAFPPLSLSLCAPRPPCLTRCVSTTFNGGRSLLVSSMALLWCWSECYPSYSPPPASVSVCHRSNHDLQTTRKRKAVEDCLIVYFTISSFCCMS